MADKVNIRHASRRGEYIRLDEERAVELDDLARDGAVQDVELHQDRVQLGGVQFEADFLCVVYMCLGVM